MADGFTHLVPAIRQEAGKWRDLADRMAPVTSAVDGLTLSWTAFFIGDLNTEVYTGAYAGFRDFYARVLGEAVTEFDQLGGALDRIADAYERGEQDAAISFDQIYTE